MSISPGRKGWWVIKPLSSPPELVELKPVAEAVRAEPTPRQVLDALDYIPPQLDRPVPFRVLDPIAPAESRLVRFTWLAVMALLAAMFAQMVLTFWAPAHGGVDQNGYLVGGRQFAYTGSTRFVPATPYEYVGNMWVMSGKDADGRAVYYPKYPIGLPILYAIPFWLGGEKFAGVYSFLVSPVSSVLSFVGMFYLGRVIAGSFAGVLGAILLASSQAVLVLMNNANSHASCLAFVVWGMFLLIRWWQTNSIWRGVLAGFFLGFACTVRYTEGLLILPIALAAVCAMRWTDWRSYLRNAVPILAWAVPVGYLLIFNKLAMGTWTGYDTTNESEFGAAFTWKKFVQTWEQMLRTFHDMGMFFVLPLGMAGLAMLFRYSWRVGLWTILWLLPGSLLYTSYYWSPDRGVSYTRFFTTFFPAVIVGFAVCTRLFALREGGSAAPTRRIAAPITAGLIVAFAAGVGVYRATLGMEDGRPMPGQSLVGLHRGQISLSVTGRQLAEHVPPESVVFCEAPRMADGMLNYGQFMGRWEMFSTQAFASSAMRTFLQNRVNDPDDANPLQWARREYLKDIYGRHTPASLIAERDKILADRLENGRRVFAVFSGATYKLTDEVAAQTFPAARYTISPVTRWRDQIPPTDLTWSAAAGQYLLGRDPSPEQMGFDTAPTPTPPPGPGFAGRRGQGPPGGRGAGERQLVYQLVEIKLK